MRKWTELVIPSSSVLHWSDSNSDYVAEQHAMNCVIAYWTSARVLVVRTSERSFQFISLHRRERSEVSWETRVFYPSARTSKSYKKWDISRKRCHGDRGDGRGIAKTVTRCGRTSVISAGLPPPTNMPNFRLFGQGVGEGEFFENSQICELDLEDKNGAGSYGKLIIDIDLVLAPYYHQYTLMCHELGYCSMFAPTRQGSPSKLIQISCFGRFCALEFSDVRTATARTATDRTAPARLRSRSVLKWLEVTQGRRQHT